MIKVFYYNINPQTTRHEIAQNRHILSRDEIKRAHAFRFEKDFNLYTSGKIMTRKIIAAEMGVGAKDIQFGHDEYSRPYLIYPNKNRFDFNLSHSGKIVVLALSDSSVGVDIERIKEIDIALAHDVFHEKEIDFVFSSSGNEINKFFTIWTLKESFIKAIGEGLSFPLKQFYFQHYKDGAKIRLLNRDVHKGGWRFSQLDIDPNYKLAICHLHNNNLQITKLNNLGND